MIRILGILGSPRRGGNTDFFMEKVLSHLNKSGFNTNSLRLADLDIRPCNACNKCYKTGRCIIRDDIDKVFKEIKLSSVIIVASPVFFLGVSAQTKILIDRSQSKWVEKYILKKTQQVTKTKKGIFISVRGGKGMEVFKCIEKPVRAFFDVHNVKYVKGIFVDGIDEKGDIKKDKMAIKKASNLIEGFISFKGGSFYGTV
jgi:multimeric flavodoxin WrbA